MNPVLKKILFWLGALVAVLFIWRIFKAWQARQALAAVYPTASDARAAAASANGDTLSLRSLFQVLPPSAQDVRATVAETDLNRLGGNAPALVNVKRFSPLNW